MSNIKFYAPVDFDDTSSGLTIDGDLIVDTNTFFVDVSTNRVGIGTSSPAHPLNVIGDAYIQTGHIHISQGSYRIKNASAGTQAIGFPSSGNFAFENVNVGIGTTSPGKKLDVNGDAYIRSGGTGQALLIGRAASQPTIKADSTNGGYLILDSLNNFLSLNHYVSQNVVANAGGGNFLIGTTTDSGAKLEVAGSVGNFKTTGHQIFLTRNGNNEIYAVGASSVLALGTNSAEKMRITSDGNVGIGTSSPRARLEVSGDIYQSWADDWNFVGQVYQTGSDYRNGIATNSATRTTQIEARSAGTDGEITFLVGTSEVARMVHGGNVGIGTTSPSDILSINSSSSDTIIHLTNTSTGTTTADGLRLGMVGTAAYFLLRENASMLFHTNNTERMRITSGGNVLIGTTTDTGQILQVNGQARFDSNVYVSEYISHLGDTNTAIRFLDDALQFNAGAVAMMKLTEGSSDTVTVNPDSADVNFQVNGDTVANLLFVDGGTSRVGIGTSSPAQKLYVNGGNIAIDNSSDVSLIFAKSGASKYEWYLDNASNNFGLYDRGNGFWRLYVNNGGNVGIGTSSPDQKLHVSGNTKTTNLYVASDIIHDGDADTKIQFNTDIINFDTAGLERLRITAGGNVGIGTASPSATLNVYNTASAPKAIFQHGTTDHLSILIGTNGGGIAVEDNNDFSIFHQDYANRAGETGLTTRLRINSSGDVGIGTTSPDQKLHVSGNAKVTGVFYTDYVQTLSGTSIDFRHQDASVVMRVDTANARVGIGTTSPAAKLEVYNTGIDSFRVGDGTNRMQWYGNGTNDINTYGASFRVYAHTNDIVFRTATTDPAVTIKQSGNVLIGTTTDSGFKLDVNGTSTFRDDLDMRTNAIDFKTSGSSVLPQFYGHRSATDLDSRDWASEGGWAYTTFDSSSSNTPSGSLHNANGLLSFNTHTGGYGHQIAMTTNTNKLHFRTRNNNAAWQSWQEITTDYDSKHFIPSADSTYNIGSTSARFANGYFDALDTAGSFFLKGSDTSTSTKNFQVQTGNGTSIMDFRNDSYAFFGCGQGGGSATGFIFRYNSTFGVQFTGYNYGNGSSPSYKPILMDTDLAGRSQGVYINYGITGYTAPAPTSNTEFAVRGRGTGSNYTAKFEDSSTNPLLYIKDNGNVTVGSSTDNGYKLDVEGDTNTNGDYHVNGNQGWSGTINIPTNPPVSITVEGGIITNVT